MYSEHQKRNAEKKAAREAAEVDDVASNAARERAAKIDAVHGDLTALSDEEFDSWHAPAIAMQEVLEAEAATAESAARKAQADFVAKPTRDAAGDKDAAQQIATTAMQAAREHLEKINALRLEHTRRRESRELLDLRVRLDSTAKHAAAATAIVGLITRFETDLREQLAEVQTFHEERAALLSRLEVLEYTRGDRRAHPRQTIEEAVGVINQRLMDRYGETLSQGSGVGKIHMSAWFANGRASSPIVDLTVRLEPRKIGV